MPLLDRRTYLSEATPNGLAISSSRECPLFCIRSDVRRTPTRLDLARWLVDADNPLVGRVTVNRIWQHYFGQGIVETPDNFGVKTPPPVHRPLLDWLATEFAARSWSVKAMHRMIVCSATYRQSSRRRPELETVDPTNRLLAAAAPAASRGGNHP